MIDEKKTKLSWGWKEVLTHDELREALETIGVKVEDDPDFIDSDQFGVIFSNPGFTEGREAMRKDVCEWFRSWDEEEFKRLVEKVEPKKLLELLATLLEK